MLDDVASVRIGHTSLGDTGVTAVVCADPRGMRAAVDVRGGGPGTRETDLLEPHNTVERVNAILLCGGSAFGLAAADGAMRELERRGAGFEVFGEGAGGPVVPIVPAAVIFDLAVGDPSHRPGAADGAAAVAAALDGAAGREAGGEARASGSIGAGCGATAGELRGGFGRARARRWAATPWRRTWWQTPWAPWWTPPRACSTATPKNRPWTWSALARWSGRCPG